MGQIIIHLDKSVDFQYKNDIHISDARFQSQNRLRNDSIYLLELDLESESRIGIRC